jgi:hypothetical protein
MVRIEGGMFLCDINSGYCVLVSEFGATDMGNIVQYLVVERKVTRISSLVVRYYNPGGDDM